MRLNAEVAFESCLQIASVETEGFARGFCQREIRDERGSLRAGRLESTSNAHSIRTHNLKVGY